MKLTMLPQCILQSMYFIKNRIFMRWMQSFRQMFQNGKRCFIGKLKLSSSREYTIKREVAIHMVELHQNFKLYTPDEDCVGNAEKTVFLLNMNSE